MNNPLHPNFIVSFASLHSDRVSGNQGQSVPVQVEQLVWSAEKRVFVLLPVGQDCVAFSRGFTGENVEMLSHPNTHLFVIHNV
jgi:hypothetical protein